MKKDHSKKNFNYPGVEIEEVIANPDEYIVPECLDACTSFWNKNIFTASCSNRAEKKDNNGNVSKFIIVGTLSDENQKKFEELAKAHPNNYRVLKRYNMTYYAIVISSRDTEQERDLDSKKLLDLASPFEMQDCMEGFVSIEDYYLNNMIMQCYPTDRVISIPDDELIATVKKHLEYERKLDLLDLNRRVVYNSMFYKKAHEKYLAYLKSQPTNPDPHDDR